MRDGREVRIVRRGPRLFFSTTAEAVAFRFAGTVDGAEPIEARYHICRSGPRPTLFMVERPGFVLTAGAVGDEAPWPEAERDDPDVPIERDAIGDGDYCRWIYRATNWTDCSVSGQVDFFNSETVTSRSSFNLGPAGEGQDLADINVIISVDQDARITRRRLFRNKVFR